MNLGIILNIIDNTKQAVMTETHEIYSTLKNIKKTTKHLNLHVLTEKSVILSAEVHLKFFKTFEFSFSLGFESILRVILSFIVTESSKLISGYFHLASE